MINLDHRIAFVVGEPILSRTKRHEAERVAHLKGPVKAFADEFDATNVLAIDNQRDGFALVALVRETAPDGPWRPGRGHAKGGWVPYGATKAARELRKRMKALGRPGLLALLDIPRGDHWQVVDGCRLIYPVLHLVGDAVFYLPNTDSDPGDDVPGLTRVRLADYVAACEQQKEAA